MKNCSKGNSNYRPILWGFSLNLIYPTISIRHFLSFSLLKRKRHFFSRCVSPPRHPKSQPDSGCEEKRKIIGLLAFCTLLPHLFTDVSAFFFLKVFISSSCTPSAKSLLKKSLFHRWGEKMLKKLSSFNG